MSIGSVTHQQEKSYERPSVILALVFVGGAGGSAIRWLVGIGVGERYKGTFPLGTYLSILPSRGGGSPI